MSLLGALLTTSTTRPESTPGSPVVRLCGALASAGTLANALKNRPALGLACPATAAPAIRSAISIDEALVAPAAMLPPIGGTTNDVRNSKALETGSSWKLVE